MKISLFLSSFWLLVASFFSPVQETLLVGNISDGKEPLIGASVRVMRGTEFVRGTITDYEGNYRVQLDPGTYNLEFSYTGFQAQRVEGLKVLANQTTTQNMVMAAATSLEEVVVTQYKVPLIEQDNSASGQTLTSDEIAKLPTRKVENINTATVAKPAKSDGPVKPAAEHPAKTTDDKRKSAPKKASAPASTTAPDASVAGTKVPSADIPGSHSIDGGAINIKGSRTEPTDYYIDGVRVAGKDSPKPALTDGMTKRMEVVFEPETYEEKIILVDDESPTPGTIAEPAPRAGLLTAGEWNDLHNWNGHWLDLLADGETDAYQNMYGFHPRQRYTVMLTNVQDFPLADAVVLLKNKSGKTLWEARTDNTGKAELWAALFGTETDTETLRAEAWVANQKHDILALKPAKDGFNTLKINVECTAPKDVDIMWAVDATGSMGDEIEYLKTELLDVIGRAKSRNPNLNYRMGAVFYRDKGDEYLTKSSALSTDITKTVAFIQQQFAGGGGDYPEAVHSALEEAVFTQKWSENAVARICFLVLDASPHQGADINASLQKSIREAARLGIRIVPIAASGIQKDTEFLMKFFGMATNGSYVFLTDHSGIGGKHLEPTTDEYKVEPLNNLLVRLITEYTSIETCEGKSEIRFENDPQQQPGPVLQALYYPNPASEQFTLELPFAVQSVTIYDSEGKAVRKLENPVSGANVVMVNDLAAGFYTIRILNNGLMQSGKLMVVKS